MQAKALLIPIAAFALSATGVSAFNSDLLEKAGLTQEQIEAFETAHELQKEGNRDGARDVLKEAGIDLNTLESVREALHDYHHQMHTAIEEAVEANNYDAFKKAIEGSPLSDIITSEDDFKMFSEAFNYRKEGNYQAAQDIMEELGAGMHPFLHHGGMMGGHMGHMFGSDKDN